MSDTSDSIPFRRRPIAAATFALAILLVAFGIYGFKHPKSEHWHFFVPCGIAISLVGIKFAAPRLPWGHVFSAGVVIWLVHFAIEKSHNVALHIVGEVLFEAICVIGFGAYWVRKGYIPAFSNRWH